MTDYSTIATAIKTTLQADAWIGNTANVKTIEVYLRESALQGGQDFPFYEKKLLPLMAIIPNVTPKGVDLSTTREIRETIACEVWTISSGQEVAAGWNNHYPIVGNLERVLSKQKTSANDLGIDALVTGVASEDSHKKVDKTLYFLSKTSFIVDLTNTF